MLPPSLNELARNRRCAVYNDLGHISPYYLTPQRYPRLFFESEILFHKRNLLLLSLLFDHVIVPTDNLLAFTRFLSKDVVSTVVSSSWFQSLVESGIIMLAGWGSSLNKDMMGNQIEYSAIYRPELKEALYTQYLRALSESASWVIREPSYGESGHINYLLPHLWRLDGIVKPNEMFKIVEVVQKTQERVGFVGTMEIFPFIDKRYAGSPETSDAFYNAYYLSWHEYCAVEYAPAIPIQTYRLPLPLTRVALGNEGAHAIAALYSPDVFSGFLTRRFGNRLTTQLLTVDVRRFAKIRNGDWARFKDKYHECVNAASSLAWIAFHPRAEDLLRDEKLLDELVTEMFKLIDRKADLSAVGGLLDVVVGTLLGIGGLGAVFKVFSQQINRRLGSAANTVVLREFEPFLRKLGTLLEASRSQTFKFQEL